MKKDYQKATIEVTTFEYSDVIKTSGEEQSDIFDN